MATDIPPSVVCEVPQAVDGDTVRCINLPKPVRLVGIDAPELPGHCRQGRTCVPGDGAWARRSLARLMAGNRVTVTFTGRDRYGRYLGILWVEEINLNCEMLRAGQAVRRYSALDC